ncbi:MAG: hypothetical protein JSR82_06965 [Verrucomicrobia bacterium]|nr:hypothetical protein [Verrucomicrobiota bacterium]
MRIFQAADRAAASTGGFTTLVALALGGDSGLAAGASCGDSKAYLQVRPADELTELTFLQTKNPPIGSGCANAQPFKCAATGGRLMVVSDGVWKYCGFEALCAAGDFPLEQVVEYLRRRIGPGLPDDFSLIVVDLE